MILAANAAIYASWSGDFTELTPRFWLRLLFVAAMVHGLWQSAVWARWVAAAFGAVLGVGGFFGLWAAHQVGLFNERPYPMVDYAAFVIASVALVAVAVILLLPNRRVSDVSPSKPLTKP